MGQRLHDEYEMVTCRGMAFRMLARVDRRAAAELSDTPAYMEYLAATKKSREDSLKYGLDYNSRLAELDGDCAWLIERG